MKPLTPSVRASTEHSQSRWTQSLCGWLERPVARPELGTLRPGTPAGIAVLDDTNHVMRTLVHGQEAFARD